MIKDPTTPQTRHYITLRNLGLQNWSNQKIQ